MYYVVRRKERCVRVIFWQERENCSGTTCRKLSYYNQLGIIFCTSADAVAGLTTIVFSRFSIGEKLDGGISFYFRNLFVIYTRACLIQARSFTNGYFRGFR